MSASWLCSTFLRPRGGAGLLALLVVGLGAAWLARPVPAQGASAAVDSGSRVRSIRVGPGGIVVDGRSVADSVRNARRERSREEVRHRVRDHIRTSIRDGVGGIEVRDGGTGVVRIWEDASVPAGETVDGDVVAVFGSVTVDGAVSRDVVAVLGSVRLGPEARVEGDVVSIGGHIDQADGATIRGESVQVGLTPVTFGLPARSVIAFAIAAGWLVSIFTGWVFALLFPTGMLRVGTIVERRPAASFFLGVLSLPGFLLAMILLCITVIGIPLAVLLPMLYVLTGYAGQLVATAVLGARLSRRSLADGLMSPLLVGTLFVAVLLGVGGMLMPGNGAAQPIALFLLLSGALLLMGLGALGTGAFLLSRFGTRPRDVIWRGHGANQAAASTMPGPLSPPATG